MAEPPDLDSLARRYLDLWQDQLAGMAADPEVAETIARTIELMNAGAAQMATAALAAQAVGGEAKEPQPHGATPEPPSAAGDRPTAASGPAASGTQAAAPAPGHADHDVAELARRIGALEQRIAALEAGPGGKGGGPEKGSRRRRA